MSKQEDDIQTLKKELKEAQKRAALAEGQLEEAKKQIKEKDKTIEKQNKEILVYTWAVDAVCGLYLGTQKERLNHEKDIPDAEWDIILNDVEQFLQTDQVASNTARLMEYLLKKGSEKTQNFFNTENKNKANPGKGKKKASEEAGKSVGERVRSVQEYDRKTGTLLDPVREGAQKAHQADVESNDVIVNACHEIISHKDPKKIEKEDVGLKGRRTPEMQKNTEVEHVCSGEKNYYCKNCGTPMRYIGNIFQFCRTLISKLNSCIDFSSKAFDLYQCPNCGRVHADIPEGVQTPVTPCHGSISLEIAIAVGILQAYGFPVNRIQMLLTSDGRNYQLGKDTLMNASNYWVVMAAGFLLFEALVKEVSRYEVLIMDETPFNILQQAGKSRKKIQASAKQAYILAVTAGPLEAHPITLYYRLESRSAESIKKVAGKFHPKVLITDGYKAYPSVLEAMTTDPDNPVSHQVCLAHWRRTLLNMIRINELSEVVLGPDGAEAAGRHIAKHDPEYLACVIVDGLRKIYGFEAGLARETPGGETLPERIARIETCRKKHAQPLMDQIDLIVKELSNRYAQFDRGRWMKKGDSLVGDAVVYYMNNRDQIRLFLTDASIAPDSNACERSIRAVVLYKQAARFKQSQGHTDCLCRWLTLVEAGVRCGVKDLHKWLTSLGEAFNRHCVDEALTARVDPDTGELRTHHIQEFTPKDWAGFDITPWLPWNYARTESEASTEPSAAPAGAEAPLS